MVDAAGGCVVDHAATGCVVVPAAAECADCACGCERGSGDCSDGALDVGIKSSFNSGNKVKSVR